MHNSIVTPIRHKYAWRALAIATLAFAANFSVWTLYAVLGIELEQRLALSRTELGFLLSSPMLTGAILRVPVGFLLAKINPKTFFIGQMLFVAPALFLLPYLETLMHYLLVGLWIGISGVSFTIGIRYITDWFNSLEQGTAMGIFGAGNAGAAITLTMVPLLLNFMKWESICVLYGWGLLLIAFLFWLLAPMQSLHHAQANKEPPSKLATLLKQPQLWRLSLYYYFVFGSFLALILWLPQYYVNAYGLNQEQALAYTLAFVVSSSTVRALGGWLADKYGGRAVNWSVFWICLICLFFLSYPPTTMTIHGFEKDLHLEIEINLWVFTSLILIIGLAQGFGRASVYKVLYDCYPNQMGPAGGIVAAIGAMGGFTLPIMFGFSSDLFGIHSTAFMVLYAVLALCMTVMFFTIKADALQKRLDFAIKNNFLEKNY